MKKVKHFLNIKSISILFFFVVGIITEFIISVIIGRLDHELIANKWGNISDVAQVSAFFSNQAYVSSDTILTFEHALDDALKEESIVSMSENSGARLWIDSYSAEGELGVSYDRGTVSLNAYGIGGDYFYFHSLKLVNGAYFSANDVIQDYCVLDREASWKLFGSDNVVGMVVDINGSPYMISGVVENPKPSIYGKAGLSNGNIYISYERFHMMNPEAQINHYEIVLPSPVKSYGYDKVKKLMGVDENEMEIVENSSRFQKLSLFKHLKELPLRAMNGKAIIYPYWENVTRVKEDFVTKLNLFETICFGIVLILLISVIVKWWRNKPYDLSSLLGMLADKCYDISAKHHEKKRKKENSHITDRFLDEVQEDIQIDDMQEDLQENLQEDLQEDLQIEDISEDISFETPQFDNVSAEAAPIDIPAETVLENMQLPNIQNDSDLGTTQ